MAETAETAEKGAQRDRSTIKFPYGDLDDAQEVARTIYENFGLSCSVDQVAAAMNQSLSGAFRAKMATASTFGVVESARGQVHLTDLGARIADPQTGATARVEAFLSVPLYDSVFERFRGARLPGDTGLEAELVKFGVAQKAASKARQSLQRSADQAGFFSLGRDRLVQPSVGMIAPEQPTPPGQTTGATQMPPPDAGVQTAAPPLTQHPLLVGLWQELPDPKVKQLDPEQQANWIETAKLVLKLLYSGESARLGVGLTYGQTPPANETRSGIVEVESEESRNERR
ncbi:MAG: hypothetical protein H0W36_12130 [Gemmatimonadetes bacterium]|nr:hypothetical protein [Gemmatimonadota bacterium]